jgi:hypothetical protein
MSSTPEDLITICKAEAEKLRPGNERQHAYITHKAERLDHLADWLQGRSDLPLDPHKWPCVLCDAEPSGLCFENRPEGTPLRPRLLDQHHAPCDRIDAHHELRADENPAERCLPTVESGPGHTYRSRCLGWGERGGIRTGENAASEDAHDHAFAGWRDTPVVPRPPSGKSGEKAMAEWRATVDRTLPVGWIEEGGPSGPTDSRWALDMSLGGAPGGGYDLSAGVDPHALRRAAAGSKPEPTQTADGRPIETIKVGEKFALDYGL